MSKFDFLMKMPLSDLMDRHNQFACDRGDHSFCKHPDSRDGEFPLKVNINELKKVSYPYAPSGSYQQIPTMRWDRTTLTNHGSRIG